MAFDYTVRGTVTSKSYFYDRDGNLTQPDPDIVASSACDFVFFRSDEKWRLDIVHPDRAFPEPVWRTITPAPEGGFVSVISYPPRPGNPGSKGNAYVVVLTNVFMPADDAYGAHASWLIFNLDDLIKKYVTSNGCPPFWKFDPAINNIRENTRNVLYTNGIFAFLNLGRHVALDAEQKVIFKNGQPETIRHAAPFDQGFLEAEYRPSSEYLNKERKVPNSGVLTYWTAMRDDQNSSRMRPVLLAELQWENKSIDLQPVALSTFTPSWTNEVASVVDMRTETTSKNPLTYISKAKQLDLSAEELLKQKRKSEAMQSAAQTAEPTRLNRAVSWIFPIFSLLSLALIFWYHKRSTNKN